MNSVYNLSIEVTRRCNMACAHCLRGDAQAIDISDEVIDAALRPLKNGAISCLTLTGGEPSLYVRGLEKVLETLKRYNISVDDFYIVTNGKVVPEEFLLTVLRYRTYTWACSQGYSELSGLALSKDEFHEDVVPENEALLRSFAFFAEDKVTEFNRPGSIIRMGRGRNFKDSRPHKVYKPEVEDNAITDGTVYISAKGDVYPDCDLEYDYGPLCVANVLKEDWTEVFESRVNGLFADGDYIVAE